MKDPILKAYYTAKKQNTGNPIFVACKVARKLGYTGEQIANLAKELRKAK